VKKQKQMTTIINLPDYPQPKEKPGQKSVENSPKEENHQSTESMFSSIKNAFLNRNFKLKMLNIILLKFPYKKLNLYISHLKPLNYCMRNIRALSVTAGIVLTITTAFSQKTLKKADAVFELGQYYRAVELYKQAYAQVGKAQRAAVLYKTGYASQEINDYKGAETYYQKSIAAGFDDPNVYFRLAEVLKNQNKYPEAIVEYNNYKAKGGNAKKADLGVKSCELSQQWKDAPMRYKIENMALINSKESDYAPSFADKKYQTLNFTSRRPGNAGGEIDANTGGNKSDIYETKVDKNGKWSTPVLLPPTVDSKFNEGVGCVSKKGDMIFFSRSPEVPGKQLKTQIYMAKKQGNTWGEAQVLPFCVDSVAYGHPYLSADGKVLYFASRMSGGYGGADIWYSTYDAKANVWGKPVNCGPAVNTDGNELYPTLSDDSKNLYFSSDTHPGMGGLDIFKAQGENNKYTKPVENMKFPLNSAFDDFSIVFEGKKNKGFLTSNREGGKGSDDIWSFNLPPLVFSVRGEVKSEGGMVNNTFKGQGEPVENVKVKIVGSDGSIKEFTTTKDGTYKLEKLKEATTYTVSTETGPTSKSANFTRDGYLANKDQRIISTAQMNSSKEFVADFDVKPVVKELHMPEIQYALGSYELLPASKDSLLFLYNIMKDNPSIVVELNSHTDSRGKAVNNMTLSTARAQSCVDFLVKEKGIPAERLKAKGYGATQLLISDAEIKKAKTKQEQEALHQKNRRTSFKILSFDYVDPNAPKDTKTNKGNNDDDDNGGGDE
jgi:peptidoglycan-associated lipoprotein